MDLGKDFTSWPCNLKIKKTKIKEIQNLLLNVYGKNIFVTEFKNLNDEEIRQRALNLRLGVPFATPVFDRAREFSQ